MAAGQPGCRDGRDAVWHGPRWACQAIEHDATPSHGTRGAQRPPAGPDPCLDRLRGRRAADHQRADITRREALREKKQDRPAARKERVKRGKKWYSAPRWSRHRPHFAFIDSLATSKLQACTLPDRRTLRRRHHAHARTACAVCTFQKGKKLILCALFLKKGNNFYQAPKMRGCFWKDGRGGRESSATCFASPIANSPRHKIGAFSRRPPPWPPPRPGKTKTGRRGKRMSCVNALREARRPRSALALQETILSGAAPRRH